MQRKVIASAVALGLSASLITVPVADAAQIGKPSTGTYEKDGEDVEDTSCQVTFTDEESRASKETLGPISGKELVDSTVGVVEKVYPELKPHRETLLKQLHEIGTGGSEGNANAETIEAWAEDFKAVAPKSVPADFVGYYLQLVLYYGSAKPDEDISELLAFRDDEFVSTTEDRGGLSFGTVEEFVSYGVPETKAKQLVQEFETSVLERKYQARERAYKPYFDQAKKVCAAGGNKTVAFPTKTTPTKPVNPGPSKPTKPDTAKPDQSKPGDKTSDQPGDNATDNAKDNGSSEDTGKIIGIVAGVLAAIGLLAAGFIAVAPQLGIALPFALPQLPF